MKNYRVKMIEVYNIVPNCNKMRKNIEEDDLEPLIESIRCCGVLQPLIVRKRTSVKSVLVNGEKIRSPKYEIVSGERRWRSAKVLNIKRLPCIVVKTDSEGSALISLNENLQRVNLNFFEQANFYREVIQKYNIDVETLASMICVTPKYIYSKLCLLKLSSEEQEVISFYNLTENHARELTRVNEEDKRKRILTKIAASGLNIYDTEDLIDEYLDPSHPEEKIKEVEKRTSIFKISDIRFFYNSLERSLSILKQAGVSFEESKVEDDNNIEISIRIKKLNKVNSD